MCCIQVKTSTAETRSFIASSAIGMMKHLTGLKQDCAYKFLNWYTSGFAAAFVAREGYYSAQPANARKYLSAPE